MRRKLNLANLLALLVTTFLLSSQPAPAQQSETTAKPEDKSRQKSGFTTVNGVKLHYLEWGQAGDVLLLLTGLGSNAHVFDDFAPQFTDRFHVIAVDRRGYGESNKPATGYDTDTRVEDIRQFLDVLKIKKISIVGHSAAGDEMTLFASLYPKRVNKLVYLEAAYYRGSIVELLLSDPGVEPYDKRMMLELQNSPEAAKVIVKDMPPENVWAINKAMFRAMVTFRPDYRKVKAPALAFYATRERYPDVPPLTDEATRRKLDEWWIKTAVPYTRASIEQFRREARRGQVVEMKDATHFIFRGTTADQVIRQTREFLLK
ncbi:MAG TPA: alpha/beta hydrolase [Pyrinomonadaceae bacterium]